MVPGPVSGDLGTGTEKFMLIQKKREREFAQYKGLTIRTIIQSIWLVLSILVAYFAIQYLLNEDIVSYGLIRGVLAVPRWVPDWGLLVGMILVFVIIMQFFFILGFVIINPLGRVRPGRPSMRKSVADPLEENRYDHR